MRRAESRSSTAPYATTTFVSLTGPAGNIGDALIRRETLRWASDTSEALIAYVGDAPDSWLEQLDLPDDALVLRTKKSVRRWLWLLATSPRHPVLVFEAGEIPLDRGNGLRELVFLVETIVVRLKGGVVIRPPRGIRAPTWPSLALHRLAARASQFALWRDAPSMELAQGGALVPDIGFAAGARTGHPWTERTELLVSLRGGRPMPDADWLRSVRESAERSGLSIRTVVQVREDEERARELAQLLDAAYDAWADTDPTLQEEALRARFDSAQIVISDRMHVLVLAALSGAIPAEFVPRPTAKITNAFATIGIDGVSLDASASEPARVRAFLHPTEDRAAEISERVRAAEAALAGVEREIRAAVRRVRT